MSVEEFHDYIDRNYDADGSPRKANEKLHSNSSPPEEIEIIHILFEVPYDWRTPILQSESATKAY